MDLIKGIADVFSISNLFYCLVGCTLGTLVGVLPGLGTSATLSILLPLTMYLDPTGSIIMLAGIFYGAQYGGSTTAILVNIPGEPSAVPACFDGFPMTKQGRAGQALWMAAVSSFIAGTLGVIAMSLIGPEIAKYALKFGPPEYFGLIFFSLTALISLSGASPIKGLCAGLLGLIFSCVGMDSLTGIKRFTFGSMAMTRGFEIVPLVVGLFGIGEMMINAEARISKIYEGKLGRMMPSLRELKKGILASLRGALVGFTPGLLPGLVVSLTPFLAYDIEKRISKHPEKFGTGIIEGVASPEAANNATAQAGFIPLMALGIPTSPSYAIMLACLMMYGLMPGPLLFTVNKQFAWTVIGSMYIGNVILLILNLPLVGLWARISTIPYKYLGPAILGICLVGAYSPRNTTFDVWVAIGFGVLGYFLRKNDWPIAPVILGFILGPMLERALRQSVSMGGALIFFHRPIPVVFFILAGIALVVSLKVLKRIPAEVLEDQSDA